MKILIACEYSGIVREAFKAKGHNAWSCDLLPTEIPGQHIQKDVLSILNDGWDIMIAHPPCTHLAVCGAPLFRYKTQAQAEALLFVRSLMYAPIKKICIENPVSVISTFIRKPDQIIHPYYFGDRIPKKTCLWLKNLPPLFWWKKEENLFPSTEVQPEYHIYNSKKTKSRKSRYSKFGKMGKGKGKERSKFFPGIANAMATQWGSICR